MKTGKKRVALILAAIMAATMTMTACNNNNNSSSGGSSTGSSSNGGSSSSSDSGNSGGGTMEPLKFSVTTCTFGENPDGKLIHETWLEKCSAAIGRELQPEFEFIQFLDYAEKIKIILAGGAIPDLLTCGWIPNADVMRYGEDGLFEELTQHWDKLPNYKAVVEADERAQYNVFSSDGKLYAFYESTYQSNGNRAFNGGGSAIRKDILDDLELDIPETIEDFHKVATAIKAAYPDKYPLMLHEEWQQPENMVFAANHTGKERVYDGEKIIYGPTTDNYKEALMEMNSWYTEGLISPDFFTHTVENGNATVASGEAFMIPSVWEGYPGQWTEQYEDQEWVFVPAVRNPKYGDPWAFYNGNPSKWALGNGYSIVLSAQSKVKDEMLALMDAQFTDEILDLLNWGIEGTTYEVLASGEKQFLPEYGPDATGSENKLAIALGQGSCRSGIFPNVRDRDADGAGAVVENIYFNGQMLENISTWNFLINNYSDSYASPGSLVFSTPLSSDENEEYANIMTPVKTYADTEKVKFIKGERSFDDWDNYLNELKAMGDIDAAMAIYQAHIVK